MDKLKLLCAVGDARHLYMCRALAAEHEVYAVGCSELPRGVKRLSELEGRADALILPMLNTAEHRGGDVFIRCAEGAVRLSELIWRLGEGAPVLGALPEEKTASLVRELGHGLRDYFQDRELVRRNCIPTAEAALEIAMQGLDVTVAGTETLILGFGNVGRECGRVFGALGSRVTCAVRREEAAAEAVAAGYRAVLMTAEGAFEGGYDLVLNTVPALVLDEERLRALGPRALVIDLASRPGGTDFEAAARLGVRAVHALSLPGKYAPRSAGEYIAEAVKRLLSEHFEDTDKRGGTEHDT
ncbi:MAG: dipicolinic acid synthetase [Ruminococcus sp.]|nr:dipicolinic acid synthetase [Ruminococcus sp.]